MNMENIPASAQQKGKRGVCVEKRPRGQWVYTERWTWREEEEEEDEGEKRESDHAIHHERRSGQGLSLSLFLCRSVLDSLAVLSSFKDGSPGISLSILYQIIYRNCIYIYTERARVYIRTDGRTDGRNVQHAPFFFIPTAPHARTQRHT